MVGITIGITIGLTIGPLRAPISSCFEPWLSVIRRHVSRIDTAYAERSLDNGPVARRSWLPHAPSVIKGTNMSKLALFLVIWLFSSGFSSAAQLHFDCNAMCAKDYYRIYSSDCVKEGRECGILCRNGPAQIDSIGGKCVRTR